MKEMSSEWKKQAIKRFIINCNGEIRCIVNGIDAKVVFENIKQENPEATMIEFNKEQYAQIVPW